MTHLLFHDTPTLAPRLNSEPCGTTARREILRNHRVLGAVLRKGGRCTSRDRQSTARVVGRVSFADVFEGPPGCVHGGFIAAAFDEVLGITQSLTGNPGMTGQLTVRYSSPTPLNADLVFEGRIDRIEGRKIFTVATLMNGETKCAEAEGLFISMRPEVFERLLRIRRGELSE